MLIAHHYSFVTLMSPGQFTMKQIFLALTFGLILSTFAFSQYTPAEPDWNQPVEPFKIAGNVYYVGASDVTSYLIKTPKGLILIDSGFRETVPQIQKNIEKLGFKMEDVKIILNSHAHYDHAGGIAELKRLTKAKFYASEKDSVLLASGGIGDPNYADKYPFEPVKADSILKDGQKIKLGGTTLKANITAGHTPGCTTWTTTVKDGSRDLNIMFICSVSSPDYKLVDNPKYPGIADDYLRTFAWLQKQKVDVFLAAHGSIYGLKGKIEKIAASAKTNPFIDPEGYKTYIEASEKAFHEKLAKQKENVK
jgi:metallo-beta-lactamase class B